MEMKGDQMMGRCIASICIVITITYGFFIPHVSYAGSISGNITSISVLTNSTNTQQVAIIYVNGTQQNPPACATTTGRFAFDLNKPMGTAAYAGAIAAWLNGTAVTISGADTPNCNVYQGVETGGSFLF